MRIASIVSAAAMLAFATAGSALAAEPYAILDGVSAQPMSSAELDSVQGAHFSVTIIEVDDSETTRFSPSRGIEGEVIFDLDTDQVVSNTLTFGFHH